MHAAGGEINFQRADPDRRRFLTIGPAAKCSDSREQLFERATAMPGYELTVDLERQWVTDDDGLRFSFEVDPFRRECLLKGLDDIGLTLQHEDKVRDHEARRVVFR